MYYQYLRLTGREADARPGLDDGLGVYAVRGLVFNKRRGGYHSLHRLVCLGGDEVALLPFLARGGRSRDYLDLVRSFARRSGGDLQLRGDLRLRRARGRGELLSTAEEHVHTYRRGARQRKQLSIVHFRSPLPFSTYYAVYASVYSLTRGGARWYDFKKKKRR